MADRVPLRDIQEVRPTRVCSSAYARMRSHERIWDEQFARPESKLLFEMMGKDAQVEIDAGTTIPMDVLIDRAAEKE